ncbi:hypothetical protein C1O33_06785 [Staphylococcus schleiferi]|nr:hypothetical protein [Staphylococcus schleiferi]NHB70684.1 hypothetical protein [Staphylococcus sp. 191]
MMVVYLLGFMIVLWLGQWIGNQLVFRQKRIWAYVWMICVLIIQGGIIYGLISELAPRAIEVLSLFYDN